MGGSDDRLTNSVGDSADVACRHLLAKKPEARPKNKSKYKRRFLVGQLIALAKKFFLSLLD
jgi:hypothetical protein